MTSAAIKNRHQYFTPETKPYGLTYGHWTIKWWQWLVSIPMDFNPAADNDGRKADVNQTNPHVWFLAGTLGGKTVNRKCRIPARKSILFPVINYEMNFIEKPELVIDSELLRHVEEDEDDIINLEAALDGQAIPIYRVQSDPPMFPLRLPMDNLFNTLVCGDTRATSDGYWVFLKSLAPGDYKLYFAGSCSAGSRNVKATYDLTVYS